MHRSPRRHCTIEFKSHAVTLALSVGRRKAAQQLDIPPTTNTLYPWLAQAHLHSPAAQRSVTCRK